MNELSSKTTEIKLTPIVSVISPQLAASIEDGVAAAVQAATAVNVATDAIKEMLTDMSVKIEKIEKALVKEATTPLRK